MLDKNLLLSSEKKIKLIGRNIILGVRYVGLVGLVVRVIIITVNCKIAVYV